MSSLKARKVQASMVITGRKRTLADQRHGNLPADAASATRDDGGFPEERFYERRRSNKTTRRSQKLLR
jgi:hypothetical protein